MLYNITKQQINLQSKLSKNWKHFSSLNHVSTVIYNLVVKYLVIFKVDIEQIFLDDKGKKIKLSVQETSLDNFLMKAR